MFHSCSSVLADSAVIENISKTFTHLFNVLSEQIDRVSLLFNDDRWYSLSPPSYDRRISLYYMSFSLGRHLSFLGSLHDGRNVYWLVRLLSRSVVTMFSSFFTCRWNLGDQSSRKPTISCLFRSIRRARHVWGQMKEYESPTRFSRSCSPSLSHLTGRNLLR